VKVEKKDTPPLLMTRVEAQYDVGLGNTLYVCGKPMTNDGSSTGWYIEAEFPTGSKLYPFTINNDSNLVVNPSEISCVPLPEKKT
jgi:hypothetical protein